MVHLRQHIPFNMIDRFSFHGRSQRMESDLTGSGVPNPFSTGGGGVTFEQLVGASYLVSLLAGDIPRGLDSGITKEVKFQQRWSGALIDDVVVTSMDKKQERRLALQIKHDLTFSAAPSNTTFARVMEDCWKIFTNSSGWKFDSDIDRIGVGIGIYKSKIASHFKPLLEIARTSKDEDEFTKRVELPSFSSKEKREYLQVIRNLLTKAKGSDVTDSEIWRFLKCFVVVHFDLENAGSRDSVNCWNRLLDQLKKRDGSQARTLFYTLVSIVGEYARSAGSIDASTLRTKIPVILKDQPNFISDLNHLRAHSNTILESIHDTIGVAVHLPRIEIVDQLEASLKEKEIVVISGEPMVGKSVLLKLLANRLRSEGEVITFSVERLAGATLENFLHNIHIKNDFQTILSAIGNAPLRCVLIDGLEQAMDEDKKRVLNDLIIAVRRYNESILAKGGHRDYCWRILCTCRLLEATNVLLHLETRRNLANDSLKMVEVGGLSDEEVAEVVTQLPKLKDLASKGHLKEILSRPLILDMLTLPDISLSPESIPSTLSESWLLDWFWKEVVRLAEGMRRGGGNPNKREQLLIRIAMESLRGDRSVAISEDMDSEAVSGLVSDRLLIKEANHLRFTHDVLKDWTLVMSLRHHKDEIPRYLIRLGQPLRLVRAFRLYASRCLEVEQSPSAWSNLLIALEDESTLSPRWYQIALTAPLFSPLLKEILPRIQSHLFGNDGALLTRFLKALRTICVQPSPTAYIVFGDLPPAEFEKYLAYWTMPIWKQWAPVVQLVLQNPDLIKDEVSFEFSHIAEKWMVNTDKNQLFRKEIATFSLEKLNDGLLQSYKDQPKNRYIKSVLWAADCLPEKVDDFVKQKAIRGRDNESYGFEELILREGWVPICKNLPKTAVDILEAILCEKIEPDRFESYHHLFMNLGIRHTMWNPPTYLKGPFLGLLRFHTDKGLELIHRITNHATQCWKKREELEWSRKPIPQNIRLKCSDVKVWGNKHVYHWYRYPSVAPNAITCALMALEYWMNTQLKEDSDPQQLFESVLKDTESAAVVGVCSSVALANWKICGEVMIPILENPAFWTMDIYRLVQDLTAESSVTAFSNYFSRGTKYDKADYNILLELARQPHRKLDIRSFVVPTLLFGPKDARERLQKAVRAFPDNPPFFFEDEKENENLVQERMGTCKIWAAQAELENYEAVKLEGQTGIQFKIPSDLKEQQKEKSKLVEEQNKLHSFQGWSMNLLDKGDIGQAFSIESGMQYAQELISHDDPSYQPMNFLEYSEQCARAIAAFAASLVIHRYKWVEENGYTAWCREQLLIAAKRPEPPANRNDEVSRFPMGYRRSAARALPILLTKNPEDREVRKTILLLALHRNNEVRNYLFNGLKALWPRDQETIWKCIDSVVKISQKKSVRKTIRNCSPKEMNTRYLQSVLYCLPSDIQISKIAQADRLLDFMENLLFLTLNAYVCYQKEDSHYNAWTYNEWNDLFFPIIANILLHLPQNVTKPKFYNHIMDKWEKTPAMMEKLLRSLILVGSRPELENRLVEFWFPIGINILSSKYCKNIGHQPSDEITNILGLLIFADPTGIIIWKAQEWKPLKKLIPFISQWCETVGHNPYCFPSLVRFLKTVGFSLIPEFGITWLYSCVTKTENHKDFFDRSRISTSLSELLYDAWSKNETSIKQNHETLGRFVFLIDMLAEEGESIAIRLQSKLQNDSKHA